MNYRTYKAKKWLLRHKRESATVLALCFLFGLPWVINSSAIVGTAATQRELPIYCVQRDNKCASLTFDAAWGNEDTQALIDILAKYKIKATFFVVGAWVDKYPESVKALHDAGHEVMSHSDDHAHFASLSADAIVQNLNKCNAFHTQLTHKITLMSRETKQFVQLRVRALSRRRKRRMDVG